MIVAAVAATRTRPASIGVKDNAKGRGAVQLTVPDMDHCIGSRRSPANFRFARKDMPISVSNANKAITAWIMLIPPKGEITSDWYVRRFECGQKLRRVVMHRDREKLLNQVAASCGAALLVSGFLASMPMTVRLMLSINLYRLTSSLR